MTRRTVPLDAAHWAWPRAKVAATTFRGRRCVAFADDANLLALAREVALTEGTIEADLAVAEQRSFHLTRSPDETHGPSSHSERWLEAAFTTPSTRAASRK